ncbi:MAG: hypothetical protein MJ069_00540 [Salinivirgaceae bacterium]|nr:hypothetical protein [Salinivirgaceae bacterium]
MKKILLLALMLCGVLSHSFAQKSFVYQAVVRDANQAVVSNQQVAVRISILANDSVCYKELQSVKTNSFGHVSLNVGMGNALAGSFDAIPWSKMNLNIGLEFDLKNGSNFGAMITNKLNAVPYALYAAQYPKAIQADGNTTGSIFSVVNANGDVVFEITENGATVYIDANDSKAAKSAFAVRGRSGAKSTEDILVVNSDGTTVYVNDDESKAAKSAFAVRGRSGAKGGDDSFVVDANGTVVYIDDEDSKAAKSAFAVRGRSGAKSNVTFKIDATGTVIYVNTDESKAAKSAFAVRGRSGAKNTTSERDYFTLSADSTRIYLNDNATFAIAKVDEPQVQLMVVSTDSVTFTVEEVVATEKVVTETGEVGVLGIPENPNLKLLESWNNEEGVNTGIIGLRFELVPSQKITALNDGDEALALVSASVKIKQTRLYEDAISEITLIEDDSALSIYGTEQSEKNATLSIDYQSSIKQYADKDDSVTIVIQPVIYSGTGDTQRYDTCDVVEYKVKVNRNPKIEYVDLGLPSGTLWATTNIGADNNYEEGNEYLSKELNENWSLPSAEDFADLFNEKYCEWELISYTPDYHTTLGYKVTSKIEGYEGNSIYFRADKFTYENNFYYGNYWTSTIDEKTNSRKYLTFRKTAKEENWQYKILISEVDTVPMFVRPVQYKEISIPQTSTVTIGYNQARVKLETTSLNGAKYSIYYKTESLENWQTQELNDTNFVFVLTDLTSNTEYQYYTQVNYRNRTYTSDTLKFTTTNEPEYIDLGLPSGTLWATTNVGAFNPEDAGNFFAWGETEAKSEYNWSTYKWYYDSSSTMTKYCTSSSYGTVDNKTEFEDADDAAAQAWGGAWKMPTKTQQDELRNECDWEWTSINDVYGYKVKSRVNDNFIFLPVAGYWDMNLHAYNGCYWSRSLSADESDAAYYLDFSASNVSLSDYDRSAGFSVRPVINIPQTSSASVGFNQARIKLETTSLDGAKYSIYYKTSSEDWQTQELNDSNFVFVLTDLTPETKYQYYTQIDYNNITLKSKTFEFTTIKEPEYVDLELPSGTLWATTNIGANTPEEFGDYYAWGETETHYSAGGNTDEPTWKDGYSVGYDWSTYKWSEGTYNTLTKYNDRYGSIIDDKKELDDDDDVAVQTWGGNWKMPTYDQLEELYNTCYWEFTESYNGKKVNGYIVYKAKDSADMGKRVLKSSEKSTTEYTIDDKHIFLPIAGCIRKTAKYTTCGIYGSRSIGYSAFEATYLVIEMNDLKINREYRCYGYSVRPVCEQ